MNLNELAREITLAEGGKVSLSIAQVKEVMRLTFKALSYEPPEKIEMLLRRYRYRRGQRQLRWNLNQLKDVGIERK